MGNAPLRALHQVSLSVCEGLDDAQLQEPEHTLHGGKGRAELVGHHPYKVGFDPIGNLQGLIRPGVLHGCCPGARQRCQELGVTIDELVGLVAVYAKHPLGPAPDE